MTHYRKEINYTDELMRDANKLMYYINQSIGILYNLPVNGGSGGQELVNIAEQLEKDFADAMNDDFNTPLALMKMTAAMRKVRQFADAQGSTDQKSRELAIGKLSVLGTLLGIVNESIYKQTLPEDASLLIKQRDDLRKSKNFEEADRMRTEIESKHGIKIEDTEYGTVWYPSDAHFK